MFSAWFGKRDVADPQTRSDAEGHGDLGVTQRPGSVPAAVEWQDQRKGKNVKAPNPTPFEQIYQTSATKPPQASSGILKVVEMAESPHLTGMSPAFKAKALLMALDAAGTNVSEVLNDAVARQRALKEYEDAYLEKVNQFEAAKVEQNRLEEAELDRITREFHARIQANLDEIDRCQRECREWQKSKQRELQRLTEAAALCVQHERAEELEREIRILPVPSRLTGTNR